MKVGLIGCPDRMSMGCRRKRRATPIFLLNKNWKLVLLPTGKGKPVGGAVFGKRSEVKVRHIKHSNRDIKDKVVCTSWKFKGKV